MSSSKADKSLREFGIRKALKGLNYSHGVIGRSGQDAMIDSRQRIGVTNICDSLSEGFSVIGSRFEKFPGHMGLELPLGNRILYGQHEVGEILQFNGDLKVDLSI